MYLHLLAILRKMEEKGKNAGMIAGLINASDGECYSRTLGNDWFVFPCLQMTTSRSFRCWTQQNLF